ncbi:MAG TPA: glycosyltransferase [Solirubrobacteraceae bacterium]|nr:glycosyltransferase [Solirubrobacteraceae bacterium]
MSASAPDHDQPLRVVILSADVGEGHVAAARALQESLMERGCASVVHEDGLRCLGRLARRLIRDGYRRQLRSAPDSFNRLYLLWRRHAVLRAAGARLLYRAGRRRLGRRVRALRPDVVVSTHPALTAALGRMRRRGQLRSVLCATITDLTDNPMWCDQGTDLHVVMDPIAIPWVERHAGVGSAVAVRPLISPRFRRAADAAQAREALGLPAHGSVVVVSGGGWGVGALDAGVAGALAGGADHVIALAGRNPAAAERLCARFGDEPRVRVLGFTDRMPELLRVADALVHGTGGMTSLEAVECGCPVIAFGTRLPHVEEHNRALEELGLCTVVRDEAALADAIAEAVRRGRRVAVAAEAPVAGAPVGGAAVAGAPVAGASVAGAAVVAAPVASAVAVPVASAVAVPVASTVAVPDASTVAADAAPAEPRPDAAAVVMAAVARVNPLPRWRLRLRRAATPAVCSVGLLWTVTTADAFSFASKMFHMHSLTSVPAWSDRLDLVVAAPAGREVADARLLDRHGIHVTFSITYRPPPAILAGVRAAGDDLVPALESSGAMRWLGTSDDLSDIRAAVGGRRFLVPRGGMSLGQYLLARSTGAQPVSPTQLPSRGSEPLHAGEIAVIGEEGPVSGRDLLALVARARRDGLRVGALP